jgi:D-glutamate cyclase
MMDAMLERIRDLVQEDVGTRGLRTDPAANLISAFPDDFSLACRSIADTPQAVVAIVTGFFIIDAQPPSAETDGPLGALFLARALCPIGIKVIFLTEPFCANALRAGLKACALSDDVPVNTLPVHGPWDQFEDGDWAGIVDGANQSPRVTHLLALERVGPTHTTESMIRQAGHDCRILEEFEQEAPHDLRGRCLTLRGRDVSHYMAPVHRLFEKDEGGTIKDNRKLSNSSFIFHPSSFPYVTIGIGDGGNEIGMGKIPWSVIRRNIPNGGKIACRAATDYLIVAGISNWGAYGLAAGVRLLRGAPFNKELYDAELEQKLLEIMVRQGPLVDGLTGKPALSVDGIEFNRYVEPLRYLGKLEFPKRT